MLMRIRAILMEEGYGIRKAVVITAMGAVVASIGYVFGCEAVLVVGAVVAVLA